MLKILRKKIRERLPVEHLPTQNLFKKAMVYRGEKDLSLTKAVIFDYKGRQIHLRDLFFHIGSARITAWCQSTFAYIYDLSLWGRIRFEFDYWIFFNLESFMLRALK